MLKYCGFFLSYYRLVGRAFIFIFLRCIKNVLFVFFFLLSFIQSFSFLFHYAPVCSLGIMGNPLKHGARMQYIPPKHGYF